MNDKVKTNILPNGYETLYTEQFYSDMNATPCYAVVFDFGRFEAAKDGWPYIKYCRCDNE